MASKKDLKQTINEAAGELFSECLFCRLYLPGTDPQKVDEILVKILDMQNDFLGRANCPDGKTNKKLVKTHYKKLKENLIKKINEIGDDIASLNSEELKIKN